MDEPPRWGTSGEALAILTAIGEGSRQHLSYLVGHGKVLTEALPGRVKRYRYDLDSVQRYVDRRQLAHATPAPQAPAENEIKDLNEQVDALQAALGLTTGDLHDAVVATLRAERDHARSDVARLEADVARLAGLVDALTEALRLARPGPRA